MALQELNNPVARRASEPLAQGKDLQTKVSQAEIQTRSWQLVRGDPRPGASNLWRYELAKDTLKVRIFKKSLLIFNRLPFTF